MVIVMLWSNKETQTHMIDRSLHFQEPEEKEEEEDEETEEQEDLEDNKRNKYWKTQTHMVFSTNTNTNNNNSTPNLTSSVCLQEFYTLSF